MRRQRGVAVVLALGVVSLAATVAVAILVTQSTWARQSELTADRIQAQALVQAGVDFARAVLSDDRRASSVDHLGEPWALKLAPMPIENGRLSGRIDDQQGAFNLNNLVRDGAVSVRHLEQFRRLLAILELPAGLAAALADWIDADGEPQPRDGAEDEYYRELRPGYLAANRPLMDVAELALVRGYDEAVRARLKPFVTALPRATAVNVNTAAPEVLAAVVEGLELDAARALAARRERIWFRNVADFSSQLPAGVRVASGDVTVASGYFLATLHVAYGGAEARGTALLARSDLGWPAIVWRKLP